MRILIDTREQTPYAFKGYEVEVETATLGCGDYSLPGFTDRVAIERKSLSDLIGCLTVGRDRFCRELKKAMSYDYFTVVVEAPLSAVSQGKYTSEMKPHAALQSILTFQIRYKSSIIWAGNRKGGEYVTSWLLSKYLRELNRKE